MTRCALPIAFLVLDACSEYGMVPQQTENSTGSTNVTGEPGTTQGTENSGEPTDNAAAGGSDEGTNLDEDGCWFGIQQAFHDEETGVKTLPVITLLSPSAVIVHAGENVTLDFAISSYNECGDIDVGEFFFGVYDFTDGSSEWLKPLNDDAVPSDFEDLDDGYEFPSYAARNMYVTPTGDQLFYVWHDETNNGEGYGQVIDTQRVTATGERVYRFTWTASGYAPVGRTFQVDFTDITWKDVATGSTIWYDWAEDYSASGSLMVDVTVVE